uniref:Phosphatidic acid phosphatase type 2/haloperoxidase domain-containing protein n=1 Tax=Astatotilapia calliptera TaxID=8154 RepID=A0AAX7TJ27_ASTCA
MAEHGKKLILVAVDILCVFAAALPSAILTLMFKPYQRGIYCDDQSIRYPYRRDTISHGTMAAVTITCSIVIITTGEAYLVHTNRLRSNSPFNQYLSALYKVVGTYLFGAAISQSLTDLAKFTIGRPRPNFIDVCKPVVCNGYMLEIKCNGSHRNVTESSSMSRPGCRGNGRDWFDPPSSSSWCRSLCMWDTRASLTTNTTRATSWWDCCRALSSLCSQSDMCPISSSSALQFLSRKHQRLNNSNVNRGLQIQNTEITATADQYERTTLQLLSPARPSHSITAAPLSKNVHRRKKQRKQRSTVCY